MSDEYENNSEILVGLGYKVETILNGAAADFKKRVWKKSVHLQIQIQTNTHISNSSKHFNTGVAFTNMSDTKYAHVG